MRESYQLYYKKSTAKIQLSYATQQTYY